MPKSTASRLVQFGRKLDTKLAAINFKVQDDQDDSTASNVAKTAAVVGGGAAALGGAALLRARFARSGGGSMAGQTAGGYKVPVMTDIKSGLNLLKGDAGSLAAKAGAGLNKAGAQVNKVGRNAVASSLMAARKAKMLIPGAK